MWWARRWAWTICVAEPTGRSSGAPGVSGEMLRYLVAGLANTAVGYGVFLFLNAVVGVAPHASNAASYAVGLLVALLLNRYFVFQGARITPTAVWRFALGFGAAYTLNLLALSVGLALGLPPWLAQIFAMVTYTVSFYLINRAWVWRDREGGA